MLNSIKSNYYLAGAAFMVGVLSSSDAHAGQTFNNVFATITNGLSNFPQLINVFSYIFGVVFSILGIFKIKQHVEQPQQNELKDGAIRLIAGGALFALPTIMQASQNFFAAGNVTQANVTAVQLR